MLQYHTHYADSQETDDQSDDDRDQLLSHGPSALEYSGGIAARRSKIEQAALEEYFVSVRYGIPSAKCH